MAYRQSMSPSKSKSVFTRAASRKHRKNFQPGGSMQGGNVKRGGGRL